MAGCPRGEMMSSHRKTRTTSKTRKRLSLAVAAAAVMVAATTAFALTLTPGASPGRTAPSQELAAHGTWWRHAHRHDARPSPSSSPSPSPNKPVRTAPSPSSPPSTKASTAPTVDATGFPGAADTGAPARTALTAVGPGGLTSGPGWAYDSRGWVEVTGSNVTLQDLYIPFNVNIVSARNVTLKDDEIYGIGAEW